MKIYRALLLPCLIFAAACGSKTPSPDEQVRLAVQATLRAIPGRTAIPLPTLPSTPTPATLSGLFCEYEFCVGHPADMAFYDVNAAQNQRAPSSRSQGILAAYNAQMFVQMVWQDAPGATDPQFMLDLILQQAGDSRNGSVEPKVVGDLNVYYASITPTPGAASTLPYGSAAAWLCGGRAFAWKSYTLQPELALSLLMDSLTRFRCESH